MQSFKFFKVLLIILFGVAGLFLFLLKKEDYKIIDYEIEGKIYKLLLADTPKKWAKGLMHKRNLKNADGMLFVFPEKRKPTFYNKNTYLDLEIYWINGSSVVAKNYLASIEKTKIIVYVEAPDYVDKVAEIVKE
ncbi:MAG: DUF192 domain-containing protein [Endomicrobiia bacterium]